MYIRWTILDSDGLLGWTLRAGECTFRSDFFSCGVGQGVAGVYLIWIASNNRGYFYLIIIMVAFLRANGVCDCAALSRAPCGMGHAGIARNVHCVGVADMRCVLCG